MKSKAEIIDALKRCKEEQCRCDGCSYYPEDSCDDSLFSDVISLLNKSDFEVLSEIISRTKRFDFECHEGPRGLMLIRLQNPAARDCLPVNIRFDKRGNIL